MKKAWSLLLLILFGVAFGSLLRAQKQDMSRTLVLKARVDELNAQSRTYYYEDPTKTIQIGEEALETARRIGYKRGEAEALNNIGVGYYFSNDYEKVLDYYQNSIKAYESLGDKKGINTVGTLYYKLTKYEKALENYLKALKIQERHKNPKKVIELMGNIAEVYRNLGDHVNALKYYRDLMQKQESLDLSPNNPYPINNIADIYFYQENYRDALFWFHKLLKFYEKTNDRQGVAGVYNRLGSCLFFLEEQEEATLYFKKSLQLQTAVQDTQGLSVSYLNLAKIEEKNQKWEQTLEYASLAFQLAGQVSDNELVRDAIQLLASTNRQMGRYREADLYQQRYSHLSDSLYQDERSKQMTYTLVLYELGQKRQENAILQTRNENYRLTLERNHLKTWRLIFGFTLVMVLILVFITYFSYRIKRQENIKLEERIQRALKKQEEQQQIIYHQASLTSLGELAAGIAHEINQPLQNISLSNEEILLEILEVQPDFRLLKQLGKDIFEDIDRIRKIVDHIRIFSSGQKEEIEEYFSPNDPIRRALGMIGQQYINHCILLTFLPDPDLPEVFGNPHKFEQVIINLLSNARDAIEERSQKESIQKEIEVTTFRQNENIVVEVHDNGCGFEMGKKTDIFLPFFTTKKLGQGTGLGLSISHGIINEMKGVIEPSSERGKGTIMRIILPIANSN